MEHDHLFHNGVSGNAALVQDRLHHGLNVSPHPELVLTGVDQPEPAGLLVHQGEVERIPEDRFGWKPHEKSYTLQKLATHIATLPTWMGITLTTDRLDLSQPFSPPSATTRAEVLALFDRTVVDARAALAAAPDQVMMQPWTLANGSTVIFSLPRVAVVRSFVMNHLIHHRAQLTVYLRLNNVPVPGMYGPSADETTM